MKKYLLLILLLLIPCINVHASTFSNGVEDIEINNDTCIYYFYKNFKDRFENNQYFVEVPGSNTCQVYLFNTAPVYQYDVMYVNSSTILMTYYFSNDNVNVNTRTAASIPPNSISYINFDFTYGSSKLTKNSSIEELDSYFIEENNSTIEFPFDKNEFYILLILIGVLIMMLFLKWCFPFRGGVDFK